MGRRCTGAIVLRLMPNKGSADSNGKDDIALVAGKRLCVQLQLQGATFMFGSLIKWMVRD